MRSYTLPNGQVIYFRFIEDKLGMLERLQPDYIPTADDLAEQADLQQARDAYQTMITRLEQIQNAGTIPFTQTGFNQVVQAVKDEALYIERIMKVLKSILT